MNRSYSRAYFYLIFFESGKRKLWFYSFSIPLSGITLLVWTKCLVYLISVLNKYVVYAHKFNKPITELNWANKYLEAWKLHQIKFSSTKQVIKPVLIYDYAMWGNAIKIIHNVSYELITPVI